MNRWSPIALAAATLMMAPPLLPSWASSAQAQRVTGLEMSIEGSLTAARGHEQLLLLTLHALDGDELRPAAGADLKVTASYRADGPIAELKTDRHGRAEVRFTPEESSDAEIVIDAFHAGSSRRFRVPVHLQHEASLTVDAFPRRAEPGDTVLIYGHALDSRGESVGAGREVRLVTPEQPPVVVRTSADGAFVARLRINDVPPNGAQGNRAPPSRARRRRGGRHGARAGRTEPRRLNVHATLVGIGPSENISAQPGASASVAVTVARRGEHHGLRARGVPRELIVAPRSPIVVDVEVRDGLGRPVRASVSRVGSREEPARAGEDGIATFTWMAPSITGLVDTVATFRVQLPGEAPIEERVTVRVASVDAVADIAPEGGALVPGVPSGLLVRAVKADGSAYVGPVTLSAPRFGRQTLTTDAQGYGATTVTLAEEATPDACGGVTAVALTVSFGDNEGQARCVPIDPDASVRAAVSVEQGELRLELHRRASVRRAPAVVTVFRMRAGALVPLSAHWVTGDRLTIERSFTGPLWVRTRLRVGRTEAEVRGTFTFVPGPASPTVSVRDGAARGNGLLASVVAPASVVEGFELNQRAPDTLAIARTVPRDIGAPFLLVSGEPVPAPPLDEPVALAILRDPWRQRALYRSGRLALLFRALEDKVEEAIGPEGLDRFTHVERGRRHFNEGVIEMIGRSGDLGPEGARDLGGEPLTIARLRAMDRAFGFDTVARRVTRKRLVELLTEWRPWVHERNLDPAFAPHADPRHWWSTFANELGWPHDGWGHPLRLRPSRGANSGAPTVVPGWSITSAGPDGRFGTSDDVSDPFAAAAPAGIYAEAVGEEALVQALRRGVLDRETIRLLDAGSLAQVANQTILNELPKPIVRKPAPFLNGTVRLSTRLGEERHETRVPPAAIAHRLLALAFGGARGIGTTSLPVMSRASARIAIHSPARLHADVPLDMPLVTVAGQSADGLSISARAEGAEVRIDNSELGPMQTGQAIERKLRLKALPGHRVAEVFVELRRGSEVVAERRLRVPVVDGLPQRSLWAGDATDGEWRVNYRIPQDAAGPTTRLVVVAPGRVDADPRLAYGPIARAWARLMAGEGESVHLSDLPESTDDLVDAARLALLYTALGEQPRRHRAAERALLRGSRELDSAGQSRLLAVLSSLALPRFAQASRGASPEAVAQDLRQRLWTSYQDEGPLLARKAAALLLSDPEDPNGRAAFVRARRKMETADDNHEAQVVPAADPRDQLAGSVALALAAHVAGDRRTRDRLVRGLGRRLHLAEDRQGDAAFWLLTAAAHGTFGRGQGSATLRTNGESRELAFENGLATATLESNDSIHLELETSGGVHLSRIETRYGRPVQAVNESPLEVAVEGIDGRAGRRAGYEVRVRATNGVAHPVLAVTLPPGADLELSALLAIEASEGVLAVSPPDARGVLRIELGAFDTGQERRFPLAFRWVGAGVQKGLAIAAWERERPWQVTSIPSRTIDVQP